MAKKEAVEATVSGNDQQVGFRALVMKQAIEYNLAGSASVGTCEIESKGGSGVRRGRGNIVLLMGRS
jgi:hypothetical protein